ncbi:MAG: bifunctional UDP-N-acetylglucosamine diphosphorylase/glucosamine-1-phosphate N-acetyltransferase GlmU [Firmicutes bacterium]|nr:bifunctional UDP-N-acetylglucosamine diphosphorylase/glucosamine-1-phosphate N-acetyltransferase GlmU [Bacillota bacterium]
MSGFRAILLAAGLGKRMKSALPKVLHKVCGKPILYHVVDSLLGAGADSIVIVVGHQGEMVEEAVKAIGVAPFKLQCVYQKEQLGTAHAVMQAENLMKDYDGPVVIAAGDVPLLPSDAVKELVASLEAKAASAVVLTTVMDDPSGYGHIVRGADGKVVKIVEDKDASPAEKSIREINSAVYSFQSKILFQMLGQVDRANAQGEYYLTDVVKVMVSKGLDVEAVVWPHPVEVMGINTRLEQAEAEGILRQRIREKLMLDGVTIIDPSSVFIDADVKIGNDTIIYPFTIIEGNSSIGQRCTIGPGARLVDTFVDDDAVVQQAVAYESQIGPRASVGPFAYLRPGTILQEGAKVGTFVEVKKSTIGKNSKVPHQSYIGDATIGKDVNVGAGTITCNYDGKRKHPTIIGDEVFIGSNTNLVAPVRVEKGAYVAAGSTITQDVPSGALGIARGLQRNIEGWVGRRRKRDESQE